MSEPRLETLPDEWLAKQNEDTAHLWLVWPMIRTGIAPAVTAVEWALYKPETPENDKWNLIKTTWADLDWWVAQYPLQDRGKVEEILTANGVRIADGVPHVLDGTGGMKRFPLHSRRTFSLERLYATKGVRVGDAAVIEPGQPAKRTPLTDAIARTLDDMLQQHKRRN